MLEFVDSLPPGAQNRNRANRGEVEQTLGQLYQNPQRWARLESNAPKSRLVTWRARADRLSDGVFEFSARPNGSGGDTVDVYGRYTGRNKEQDEHPSGLTGQVI